MDNTGITAIETFLAGFAAIGAVFLGYFIVRAQINKTAKTTWIASFRIECAALLTVTNKLILNNGAFDLHECYRTTMSLRLYLNSQIPTQLLLMNEIIQLNNDMANPNFQAGVRADNTQLGRRINDLMSLMEDVILEVQRSI